MAANYEILLLQHLDIANIATVAEQEKAPLWSVRYSSIQVCTARTTRFAHSQHAREYAWGVNAYISALESEPSSQLSDST